MYGVCYSFNFIGHNSTQKPRYLALPGQFYGLELELNTEGEYYLR
jgi:hypothetical protein